MASAGSQIPHSRVEVTEKNSYESRKRSVTDLTGQRDKCTVFSVRCSVLGVLGRGKGGLRLGVGGTGGLITLVTPWGVKHPPEERYSVVGRGNLVWVMGWAGSRWD